MPDYFDNGAILVDERFAGKAPNGRRPAWHGKGEELTVAEMNGYTIADLMRRANLTEEVHTIPMLDLIRDDVALSNGAAIAGWEDMVALIMQLPDQDAVVQRIVSKGYAPIQPFDLADILEPLRESFQLNSVFTVKKGAIMVVSFELGEFRVGNHEQESYVDYLHFNDRYDGSGGTQVLYSCVREVCANTIEIATETAIGSVTIEHRGDNAQRVKFRAELERAISQSRRAVQTQLEAMLKIKVDKDTIATVLEAAYPDPERGARLLEWDAANEKSVRKLMDDQTMEDQEPTVAKALQQYEYDMARMQRQRTDTAVLFNEFNDNHSYAANTGYALAQALFENADFGYGHKSGREWSVLNGDRRNAKLAGVKAIMALAGK